jgi:hypothetical protein
MKSGWQMSSQSPVVWWYREVKCEVVGMSVEAVPESVDFLFNWCDLKILSKDHIRHVPWCMGYHAQDFPLEAFQYFDVGELLELSPRVVFRRSRWVWGCLYRLEVCWLWKVWTYGQAASTFWRVWWQDVMKVCGFSMWCPSVLFKPSA